MILLDLI